MIERELRKTLEKELDKWDVDHSYSHKSKHARLTISTGTSSRFLTLPVSSSDYRASRNLLSVLKKTLVELGAQPTTVH